MGITQHQAVTNELGSSTQSFYDDIARLYDLTFKVNRYGRSIENYLRMHLPPLPRDARILDAGCGTGLLTLSLLRVLKRSAQITALDLSASSLATARQAISEATTQRASQSVSPERHRVCFAQANVLTLPFADESFDLLVTSGALEYVSLDAGMSELARVLRPGGYLIYLPVRPSLASTMLEWMFRFKTHPPHEVAETTTRYFQIISHYRFPPLDPIGWTKTAVLAQRV